MMKGVPVILPWRLLSLTALCALLPACFQGIPACFFAPPGCPSPDPPLSERLANDPDLSTLAAELEAEGLLAELEDLRALTLFAPTNDAFPTVATQQISRSDVLRYHAVFEDVSSISIRDGWVLPTLYASSALAVNTSGGVTLSDGSGAPVTVDADHISITNGRIYKIDAVLTPPAIITEVTASEGFSILLSALTTVDLVDRFNDLAGRSSTLFAPTNAAFEALFVTEGVADLDGFIAKLGVDAVRHMLLYHTVAGLFGENDMRYAASAGRPVSTFLPLTPLEFTLDAGAVVITNDAGVGTATVVATNMVAANGVVHAVDQVLIPPASQ